MAATGVPVSVPATGPSTGTSSSQQQSNLVRADVLFSGVLIKAGDDNSRWKKRYFQLIALPNVPGGLAATTSRVRLQYFESDRDAQKGKPCRGELTIADIGGIAVFSGRTAPLIGAGADAAVQACARLTSEHVQEGPVRLMLWGRDRLWRLAETSTETNVLGELIRALDRVQLIPKVAIRSAGWMRTQGTLNWNRRYAILLSSGDLMLFRDASLDQLRRRIDLARAQDIRPLQPLAPAGSQQEKRVVRILGYSMSGGGPGSWDTDVSADGYELVGIRIRHPDIPEARGYIMCVEATATDDASSHYARFRAWIVQLQLSAAEARLSGFTSRDASTSDNATSAENEEALERKLFQVVQSSASPTASSSREISIGIALPYLLRVGNFPALWRSALWFVLSGGALLKRTLGATYSQLFARDQDSDSISNPIMRLSTALRRVDSRLKGFEAPLKLFLQFGGEESAFWTMASLAATIPKPSQTATAGSSSSSTSSLHGLFHSGFGSYVESRVIIDLLGLAKPNLVAHLSAYDLTTVLCDRCVRFVTGGCTIPQVWDAVCVLGKEAFAFAAVSLLAEKEKQLLECFSKEDLGKVVDAAFADSSEMRFRWERLDVRVADQVRRAQWSSVVDIMRDHGKFSLAWKSAAEEIHILGRRMVQQCNRLVGADHIDDEESLEQIHQCAVAMMGSSNKVVSTAEMVHTRLERELRRSGHAGVSVDSSSKASSDLAMDDDPSVVNASSLASEVEVLNMCVTVFAWHCLTLGWKSWCRANRLAYASCRFIPRAAIRSASLAQQVPAPILRANSLDQLHPLSLTGAVVSAQPPPAAQLSSSFPSRPVLLQSVSPSAVSPTLDDANPDASSFKSIAIGLGKRLFQQRFMPGGGANHQHPTEQATTAAGTLMLPSSINIQSVSGAPDKPPAAAVLTSEGPPVHLLKRYNGGFVGLGELAGSTIDAALLRDAQSKDEGLMHLLDVLDVALRASSSAERLVRWMFTRDPPLGVTDVPDELKGLFVAQAITLDRDGLKVLEESLAELTRRCSPLA